MSDNGNNIEKTSFVAPKLEVFGRARDITRAVGNKGNADNGKASTDKTGA